ncbi:MAG: hypothetical protein ABW174_13555 [Flavitalea sp.]
MQSNQQLEALQDIKRMMERSSRFISLSGLSGVAAGICALVGAWFGWRELEDFSNATGNYPVGTSVLVLEMRLIWIAAFVFAGALVTAFLFTYRRAQKHNLSVWDGTARRLMINTVLPLAAGGLFIMGMLYHGVSMFVGSASLVFYGLALLNGSKYTVGEIKYIGYGEIILGLVNLWFINYSLIFWIIGFGFLHIFYGIVMWVKYDRN